MRRTVALRLLLSVAVVLAGCSAAAPERDPPAVTPAAVPEGPPPGLSEERVTNATRLVAEHVDALSGVTATRVENRTVRTENGSLVAKNRTVMSGADARLEIARVDRPGESVTYSRWQNDTTAVGWVERDGRRERYRLDDVSTLARGVYDERTRLRAVLRRATGETVAAGDCGGTRCFVVSFTTRGDRSSGRLAPAGPVRYDLTVTADGLVRELVARWEERRGGETVSVRDRVAFRGVGETAVEVPPWAAAASEYGR